MGKFLQGLAEELTLYAQQLGWLHATPEPPKGAQGEPDRRSRIARLKESDREADVPEVRATHLVGYLFDIGPAIAGGAGPAPITQGEIRAWQDNTGIELTAWEVRTLRNASREYVSEMSQAADPRRPAPYSQDERAPAFVANDMRAAIRAMART